MPSTWSFGFPAESHSFRSARGEHVAFEPVLPAPICAAPVVDSKDDDRSRLLLDPIEHPVAAAPSAVDARKLVAKLASDSMWVVDQSRRDEVDGGCRDDLRQILGDGSARRAG